MPFPALRPALSALLALAGVFPGPPATPDRPGPARAPRPARQVELATPRVRVPFGRVDRRVSIAVLVEGQGPYHFILDTGASGDGRIDIRLAEELGLRRVGQVLQDDTTGSGAVVRDSVAVDELRIAGATFRNVTLTSSDYAWIAGEDQLPVSGILGLGLFEEVLLEIDYPAYRIELSRGRLERGAPNTLRYSHSQGRSQGLCSVPVRIGDVELSAILDTGSAAGLLVPESWRDELKTTRAPRLSARGRLANNRFHVKSAPLREPLQLGAHRIEDLEVGFVNVDLLPNVGYEILRDFVVTVDQAGRRVRIERSSGLGG